MPRSPWLASAAWTNCAGVPVEARVAAILRATWPLLPMPVTISRPRAAAHRSSATPEGAVEGLGQLLEPVDLGPDDPPGHREIAL